MATLKEAVESGRRWRYCYLDGDVTDWFGPGSKNVSVQWTTTQALSFRFEIEPEPERCKSVQIDRRCRLDLGHVGEHKWWDVGVGQSWSNPPEPEKPREWTAYLAASQTTTPHFHIGSGACDGMADVIIRVHDADACDHSIADTRHKLAELQDAVDWVVTDSGYKAPEQASAAAVAWIARLRRARRG